MRKPIKESRPGRFSYLLKGRARPRRSLALMMALVIVAVMSMATVVSADDYYKGLVPSTNATGVVNGGVWVDWKDGWNTTPMDWSDPTYEKTVTFSVPATGSNVKFARLYVVPYTGHMTNNYKGELTVTMKNGTASVPLASDEPLMLNYDNTSGATRVYPTNTTYWHELNRVTSDYVAIFDVKDLINNQTMFVDVMTRNRSDLGPYYKFDGRIKEVKLVIAYNTSTCPQADTYYFVNEGHDPITVKDPGTYSANVTNFNDVPAEYRNAYKADLWVDFVAGNSTSGMGYGAYKWNTDKDISPESGTYLPESWQETSYSGISHWTWNSTVSTIGLSQNNSLRYARTNNYYKFLVGVLAVRKGSVYDFSGNYCGIPGTNEWAYGNDTSPRPPTAPHNPQISLTSYSPIAANDDVYLTTDGSYTKYATQRFNFTISEDRSKVISLMATWVGQGYHGNSVKNGAYFYIWNWNSGSYEQLATTTSGDKVTLSGEKTSSLTNYISSEGKVIVIAMQSNASERSNASHLATDYIKLVVVDP